MLLSHGDHDDTGVTAGQKTLMLHPCRLMPFASICRDAEKPDLLWREERNPRSGLRTAVQQGLRAPK